MLAQQHLLDLIEAALLAGTPAWSGAGYQRQRVRPMPAGVTQGVRLRWAGSDAVPMLLGGNTPTLWVTRVGIECMARADAATTPDAAVGPLLADVHARVLGAFSTLQAGGFELDVEGIRIVPDEDELDERIGAAAIVYPFRHRTDFASLAG